MPVKEKIAKFSYRLSNIERHSLKSGAQLIEDKQSDSFKWWKTLGLTDQNYQNYPDSISSKSVWIGWDSFCSGYHLVTDINLD